MKSIQGEVSQYNENMQNQLAFTGNWFIDAGILGFVNLMEEVYGWDLNELQDRINTDSHKLFFWFFPIGYLFYHSTIRGIHGYIQNINKDLYKENGLNQKIRETEKEIKNLQDKIAKCNNEKEEKKLQNKLSKLEDKKLPELKEKKREALYKIEELNNKLVEERKKFRENTIKPIDYFNLGMAEIDKFLPNFSLRLPAIARNFYLFNSKEIRNSPFLAFIYLQSLCWENYEGLSEFIKEKIPKTEKAKEGLTYEIYPDSTINPFLYSPSQFPNMGYTKPLKTLEIEKSLKLSLPIFIPLLCFEHTFENYYEKGVIRNIFFYTNNLDLCYSINKKMQIRKEKAKSKHQSLLKITFNSIIDELVENKADFSLENMYLVEYEEIENQKLINVEYIGVPKLQASIFIDDVLREALNISIVHRKTKENHFELKWLPEEFIKGRPLYPLILSHAYLVLNKEIKPSYYSSLYSLIIEANILYFRAENEKPNSTIFSENYFNNYKGLVQGIKEDVRRTSYHASLIKEISKDKDKKARIARDLISALKAKDKNLFLNILLKNLNESKELASNDSFNRWLMEKIVRNDACFEIYGLILVMNLVRG